MIVVVVIHYIYNTFYKQILDFSANVVRVFKSVRIVFIHFIFVLLKNRKLVIELFRSKLKC